MTNLITTTADSEALRAMARRVAKLRAVVRENNAHYGELRRQLNLAEHDAHGSWRSWKVTARLASWAYSLGLIAGYGHRYTSACSGCLSGVSWRGRRLYVLGGRREQWRCLFTGWHVRREIPDAPVVCAVCSPCPECGSSDPAHWTCDSVVAS